MGRAVICSLCQKTFVGHLEPGEECPGDFPEDVEVGPIPFGLKLRWFLRHPIARLAEIAEGFRFSVARDIQASCETSYSLAHSRMVRDRVLEMSWPAFFVVVSFMMGINTAYRVCNALGLISASAAITGWLAKRLKRAR